MTEGSSSQLNNRPDELDTALRAVLFQAHDYGFFGPGDLTPAIEHAMGFVRVAEANAIGPTERWIDLGSGGGLPGLVGAARRPGTHWTLLDAQEKRVTFLRWAIGELGQAIDDATERIAVAHGRAEVLARATGAAESIDVAVARGFAPPPITAECAARFLRVDGILVVSEPPHANGERWVGLDTSGIGLQFDRVVVDEGSGARFSVIRKVAGTPEKFPRAGAALSKRPLFVEPLSPTTGDPSTD